MLPLIRIGPLALSSFGLVLLISLWLGSEAVARLSKRAGLSHAVADWLPFVVIGFGLLGARVWYVLFNLDLYRAQPQLITQLSLSAFAFPGALFSSMAVLWIYRQQSRRRLLPWLDVVVRVLPWAQALGMLGLLLSGEAYGAPTTLPWRIHLLGVDRHPSQIYEAVALILLGVWLWRSAQQRPAIGQLTAQYLGGYGAIRLALEPLRSDSLVVGNIRVAQVVGLVLLLGSIRWIGYLRATIRPDRSTQQAV